MMPTTELIEWLKALPPGSGVGIDEGGLCLRCPEVLDAYCEVGGIPEHVERAMETGDPDAVKRALAGEGED